MKETIYLESLGCPKNLVDSEVMLGYLSKGGYSFTTTKEDADVIIINTCAFIQEATEEAIDTILNLATYKETGRCRCLVVTGCLPQRYGEALLRELKEVDLLVGVGEFHKIVDFLKKKLKSPSPTSLHVGAPTFLLNHTTPRTIATPPYTAYVKISEGCSHRCSFCTIPHIKGPYRSRPLHSITAEVTMLSEKGVREINLVAQDTTFYGKDLPTNTDLTSLLKQLSRIDNIEWIRLLYCHPDYVTDDLITVIKEEAKICSYLDLPLQHISDSVLKKMRRTHSSLKIKNLIKKLRGEIPHLWIRTTMMVGFPGETEEDFKLLMNFIKEVEFEHLGAFKYSGEEGTASYGFKGKVRPQVMAARHHRMMETQSQISLKKNRSLIGSYQKVLVEGTSKESGALIGRTYFQAPDIDGLVYLEGGPAEPGQMVKTKITDASEYDLFAHIL